MEYLQRGGSKQQGNINGMEIGVFRLSETLTLDGEP